MVERSRIKNVKNVQTKMVEKRVTKMELSLIYIQNGTQQDISLRYIFR